MQHRFFINTPDAENVARKWLDRDISEARLSTVFRAYYCLRPVIPISLRQQLQRVRKVKALDDWYLPNAFLSELVESIRDHSQTLEIIHPWPEAAQFAFVLTHDVETEDGLRNIGAIADMEQEFGFRSSWNLVPYKYKIDKGLVRDLQSRSFEIGIHGYNHDGRLYQSRQTFERRAAAINAALREYDAVGFRSPMVQRNLEWLQILNIQYDASCFDIDPYQSMPGGVGGIWPFIVGDLVELPYTLPQDHTLFIARDEEDCSTWKHKLNYVSRQCGMALMLTHPDYLVVPKRLDLYREFLQFVRQQGAFWHALPREVASWWRQRDRYTTQTIEQAHIVSPTQVNLVPAILELNNEGLSIRAVDSESAPEHPGSQGVVPANPLSPKRSISCPSA